MTDQAVPGPDTGPDTCPDTLVDSPLVGEAWPAVQPGTDPAQYGQVAFAPTAPVEVRSAQSFTLTFTVGRFGIDDRGAIRVLFRAVGDGGRLQTRDPQAENYVTAQASNGVALQLSYSPGGVSSRPRRKALTVTVAGGYLASGDRITVIFGDRSGGSPGMRMQSFAEAQFEFKVVADVCASGHFVPIPHTPFVPIVAGPPVRWQAVLPSLRRPGEAFAFGLKAEDLWGNLTAQAQGALRLETTLPVHNLPRQFAYPSGSRAHSFEGLSVDTEGELRITIRDAGTGVALARSAPMMVRAGPHAGYWGDLHGQSGESIGIGTARDYFSFARDCAFLDVAAHQANDFQLNNAFWAHLNALTAEFNAPGRFVTFPGYEWSGNTAVGGDRNVYFRAEGRQIHRSSHALLTERGDIDSDANDAGALFAALADEECVVYAHVGGRYADIARAHDAKLETAVEIHSAWGTFEWLLTDAFALGYRPGVVCNSDGHKGRPGASYPGAGTFGAKGGLTCFLARDLSRDALFAALRKRHHYGTSGSRIHLGVSAHFPTGGRLFDADPQAFADAASHHVDTAMMGDIVATADRAVTLEVEVAARAPIERIEVRNGAGVLHSLRPHDASQLGNRLRVIWSGAEYRGRGREARWKGSLVFAGAQITRFKAINAFNPERQPVQQGSDTILFDAITTGNFGGVDVWLKDADAKGLFVATTNHGTMVVPLEEIGVQDKVMQAGGLDRKLRVFRLPDHTDTRTMTASVRVPLNPVGDNPIWVCATTEDGFQAWSSPIYIFNSPAT